MSGLSVNWSEIVEPVARSLLGEPNGQLCGRHDLRFGRKGSLSVDLRAACWFDFEAQEGGGVLDLIAREIGVDRSGAMRWLGEHGFVDTERGVGSVGRAGPVAGRLLRGTSDVVAARDRAPDRERVAKTELAARQWHKAGRIEGTPGARYLRRRGLRGWPGPEVLRWCDAFEAWPGDPQRRPALLISFRDASGAVVGVQAIRLTPEGRKVAHQSKTSLGSISEGVCVLPGHGDLHLAEGLETALSVWAATGAPVMVCGGPVSSRRVCAAPVGPCGSIVLCADAHAAQLDHGGQHPVARSLSAAIAAAHERELAVRVAVPPGRDGRDWNDLHQAEGLEAVRAGIAAARWQLPPRWDTATALAPCGTVAAARERVAEAFECWTAGVLSYWDAEGVSGEGALPEPLVSAVRVGTGIGKSYAARRAAVDLVRRLRAQGDRRAVVIAVPRHNLAGEYLEALQGLAGDLRIASWRGRGSADPGSEGATMCRRSADAGALLGAGLEVERHLCRRRLADGSEQRCPFFEGCAYLGQREVDADIWLVQHAMIWQRPPAAIAPAALIVDEDATAGAMGASERLSVSDIRWALEVRDHKDATGDLRAICGRVATALVGQCGLVDLAPLRAAVTPEDLAKARRLALGARVEPECHPGSSEPAIARALRHITPHNQRALRLAKLLALLRDALEAGHDTVPGLACGKGKTDEGDTYEVVQMRVGRKVAEGWTVPTLLASATASPEVLREIWPSLGAVTEAAASAPFVRVRQITDRQFGAVSLCPALDTSGEKQLRHAAGTRARLLRYIEVRAAQLGGRVLVVCQKAAEDLLRREGLPANVDTAHFGNLDGLDCWREVSGVIVIGRPQPRPLEVEQMAEALTGRPVARPVGWYDTVPGCLNMHGSGAGPAVYRRQGRGHDIRLGYDRHPDPVAEALRWGICEGELLQAIGRGRGVNRSAETPLAVDLLTAVPLPVAVDEAGSFATFEPTAVDVMHARGVEVLDTSVRGAWALVASVLPDMFPTANAARVAMKRLGARNPFKINNGLCARKGFGLARVRRSGRRCGQVPVAIRAARARGARAVLARVLPDAELLAFEPPTPLDELEGPAPLRTGVQGSDAPLAGDLLADTLLPVAEDETAPLAAHAPVAEDVMVARGVDGLDTAPCAKGAPEVARLPDICATRRGAQGPLGRLKRSAFPLRPQMKANRAQGLSDVGQVATICASSFGRHALCARNPFKINNGLCARKGFGLARVRGSGLRFGRVPVAIRVAVGFWSRILPDGHCLALARGAGFGARDGPEVLALPRSESAAAVP